MFNSREMLHIVADHQREIREQVEFARLADGAAPVDRQPRYAILLANLGGTLITIGEALQHRYAGLCEQVATSNERPAVDDGLRVRA
jgi:hypothetical protein